MTSSANNLLSTPTQPLSLTCSFGFLGLPCFVVSLVHYKYKTCTHIKTNKHPNTVTSNGQFVFSYRTTVWNVATVCSFLSKMNKRGFFFYEKQNLPCLLVRFAFLRFPAMPQLVSKMQVSSQAYPALNQTTDFIKHSDPDLLSNRRNCTCSN